MYSSGSYNDLRQFGGDGIAQKPTPKYRLPDWYERPCCLTCGTPMLTKEAAVCAETGIVPPTHTSARPLTIEEPPDKRKET